MPSFKAQIVIDATVGISSEQAAELEQQLRDDAETDDLSPFGKYAVRILHEQGVEAALAALIKKALKDITTSELTEAFDDGSIRFKMAPPSVILTPKEPKNVSN